MNVWLCFQLQLQLQQRLRLRLQLLLRLLLLFQFLLPASAPAPAPSSCPTLTAINFMAETTYITKLLVTRFSSLGSRPSFLPYIFHSNCSPPLLPSSATLLPPRSPFFLICIQAFFLTQELTPPPDLAQLKVTNQLKSQPTLAAATAVAIFIFMPISIYISYSIVYIRKAGIVFAVFNKQMQQS